MGEGWLSGDWHSDTLEGTLSLALRNLGLRARWGRAIAHEAAKVGLRLRASHAFGQNYARTCRIWCETMMQHRPRIQRLGYDDAFLRGWKFYLEGCAAAFATARCNVVQITLGHAQEVA